MTVYLGTDPECFIVDRDGRGVPAHTYLPGKDAKLELGRTLGLVSPTPLLPTLGLGHTKLFRDGYAAELNTRGGCHCRAYMINEVANGFSLLKSLLKNGERISTQPTIAVDLDGLRDAPPDVQTFGCDPAWNAYTGEPGVARIDARTYPYRHIGGHMHFSAGDASALANLSDYPLIIKMLDLYVGLPLTFLFGSEATFLRREHYGKAGEFRVQEWPARAPRDICPCPNCAMNAVSYNYKLRRLYGLEYRTPDAELFSHPEIVSAFFNQGRWVIGNFSKLKEKWNPKLEPGLEVAINHGKGVEELLEEVKFDSDLHLNLTDLYNWKSLKGENIHKFTLLDKNEDFSYNGWGEWKSAHPTPRKLQQKAA